MKTKINSGDVSLLATRLIVAFVTAAHGVQKLFGWFNGYGFDGTMAFFTDTIGIPYAFGLAIILVETIGMIALALGLWGKFFSGFVIAIMLGAIFSFHLPNGFYMNWNGNLKGEGYEFHILLIGLALPVLLQGSGAYSLDNLMSIKSRRGKALASEVA